MNKDFVELLERNEKHAQNLEGIKSVQDGQNPDFVTVCCSDSRVLQDHMWSNEQPGEIFTASNIGNRVYQEEDGEKFVSGDMIYPVAHADTDTMIVVGHTGCGAVTATYQHVKGELSYDEEPKGVQRCITLLKSVVEEGVKEIPEGLSEEEEINHLVEFNVDRQVEFLINSDEIDENVDVLGVVYDLHNVYSGDHGHTAVININGENNVEKLKEQYSDLEKRVERL